MSDCIEISVSEFHDRNVCYLIYDLHPICTEQLNGSNSGKNIHEYFTLDLLKAANMQNFNTYSRASMQNTSIFNASGCPPYSWLAKREIRKLQGRG